MRRRFPAYSGSVNETTLNGVSVLVAGAGLAGLAAARDLIAMGATVTVIDVRDRVGGRVWTIRDGFSESQHAEAGGDLIDEEQHSIRELAGELGLKLTRILKGGFGYVRADQGGRPKIAARTATRGWARLAGELRDLTRPYNLAERRWDSPIAGEWGRAAGRGVGGDAGVVTWGDGGRQAGGRHRRDGHCALLTQDSPC